MSVNKLNFIVFGATGFTGKFVVMEMMALAKKIENLTWGVAGRSDSKLQALLKSISNETGESITNIPVLIADINNEASLLEMASRARIVLNCCGPYRFYGEAVIKACIESGTHHLDVSGEPQFMERMEVEYNDKAAEKGVYIISACGFDSIPAEIGFNHFLQEFGGDVEYVEAFLKAKSKVRGTVIHYGTWESAVYGLTHANELRNLRRKLFSKRLPDIPSNQKKSIIHKSNVVDAWCMPFPGADRSVIQRSQRLFLEKQHQRPVPMQIFISFKSLFATLAVAFVGIIFGLMTKTSFTRNLLLKHPKFFSFNAVSHEGPSQEQRIHSEFFITFFGKGWSGDKIDANEQHNGPTDKILKTRVSGRDPGYGFTAAALVLAGFTVFKESDKMPGRGGVLPPGFAFANTSLKAQLAEHTSGLKFEILHQ
uniref:Saccharopine dehydrogenase NADP binding domain-containing protein n=1 Tax=Clastoptera arizonana TaxID=38151 RepID=A0A1B6DUC4_9HEMI